jgi:aminopeptidase C
MFDEGREKEFQKCWEFVNCPDEYIKKCTAYNLNGCEDCWFFNDVGIGGPRRKDHIGCLDCPVYKKKFMVDSILLNDNTK